MNESTIPIVPYEHTINKIESDEEIYIEEKRTMLVVKKIKIEAGGKIIIPNGAKLAVIGGS
jgi:hypothetical protein